MHTTQLPAATFFLALAAGLHASAQTHIIELPAIADTTIIRNNNDSAAHLSNGSGEGIFAGRTYVHADYDHRALVRFDLSMLPCNARVTAAVLVLTLISGPSQVPPSLITTHRALALWGEGASSDFGGRGAPSEPGDADWTHRLFPDTPWTTSGGDYAPLADSTVAVPSTTNLLVQWPSTTATVDTANTWLRSPSTNFGWLLLADESHLGTVRKFASRNNGDSVTRPVLHLDYFICIADFDCSGAANVQDIFRFLGGWFAAEPATDVNASGAITIADIFDFLAAWFAGC